MAYFAHDGLKLAYDDSGERDRPAVVFLHGLSSARTTWWRIAPSVADRCRVVALDQRGHGESEHAAGDTYVLAKYNADTIAFCEEVVGQPAVLVGHSLGGVVAASVAAQRPDLVRGLLLEDPPLYRGQDSQRSPSGVAAFFPVLQQVLRDLQARGAPVEECEAMLAATPAMNGTSTLADVMGPHGAREHALAWMRVDPEVFTAAIDGHALADATPDAPLACPTILLRADPALGAAFTTDDAQLFARSNPDAIVKVVDGASHIIHDEQPELFNRELGELLANVQT